MNQICRKKDQVIIFCAFYFPHILEVYLWILHQLLANMSYFSALKLKKINVTVKQHFETFSVVIMNLTSKELNFWDNSLEQPHPPHDLNLS